MEQNEVQLKDDMAADMLVLAGFKSSLEDMAAEKTAGVRKSLPSSAFVIPEQRRYPIHDEAHAKIAMVRVSEFGSDSEKLAVRRAVRARYPDIVKD